MNVHLAGETLEMEEITEKKRAIFESTLALVRENGFHGTPMSQIARNAGVAAGTIYHHFDSKDTLIMELYGYLRQEMTSSLLKMDDDQMAFKERFFNYFISHSLFYIEHPNALFFMEQFVNSPYNNGYPNPVYDGVKTFKSLIAQGVEDGLLKPMDPRILGSLVHGAVVSTAKIHLCRKINLQTNEIRQVAHIIWDGISRAAES
jgi:TetR/AcrR family transcriptional regulator, multidrug resistance operon repressor